MIKYVYRVNQLFSRKLHLIAQQHNNISQLTTKTNHTSNRMNKQWLHTLLLPTTALLLSAFSNNANAQNAFEKIELVTSSQSCFAGERNNYQGFITYSTNELKQSMGRRARHLTRDLLAKKLPEARYKALKQQLNCTLFTYRVGDTLVDGFRLSSNNDSPNKPVLIMNRGGNGSFGRFTPV